MIVTLSQIRVVPLPRNDRYYQFIVKTSTDGKTWNTFLDMSQNTKPLGMEGACYTGQPTPVRFIRVENIRNSLDEGKHLVAVMAK